MADIIELTNALRRDRAQTRPDQPATIIIFPGIRYERRDDPSPDGDAGEGAQVIRRRRPRRGAH